MAEFREITTDQEFKEILDDSRQRKVILFKHSTACPISGRAWSEVQNFIKESSNEVLVVMIKVIESRSVSNQITAELGTKHESPQVLLLFNKKVSWHTSHQAVTQNNIKKAIAGEKEPLI
ncbi:MAG: bacillithiol system redox-active protein YtxJ [Bacillota bacterium]|nr:bacillithiol system redox-active protein YtxJ [Bacillota bacterium]